MPSATYETSVTLGGVETFRIDRRTGARLERTNYARISDADYNPTRTQDMSETTAERAWLKDAEEKLARRGEAGTRIRNRAMQLMQAVRARGVYIRWVDILKETLEDDASGKAATESKVHDRALEIANSATALGKHVPFHAALSQARSERR